MFVSCLHLTLKYYISDNLSIVDFGCGNKEILEFCNPSEYLGIDITPNADLILDLNKEFSLDKFFDLGLLLGVLEYVDDPNFTLNNIKLFAKKFIVVTLPVKKKSEWKRAFTEESIDTLLRTHLKNIQHFQHGRYILSIGESL